MTDDPVDDSLQAAPRWLTEANETFRRAALEHASWAHAVQADASLKERLEKLAQLKPAIAAEMDAVYRMAAQPIISSAEGIAAQLGRDAEARRAIAAQVQGVTKISPGLQAFVRELVATPTGLLASTAVQQFAEIQRSLNKLNRPATARQTLTFITETGSLRYRSNRRVWHYTTAAALDQILRNHVLWASSPQHLNDESELIHGVSIVKDAVDRALAAGDLNADAESVLRDVTDGSYIEEAMNNVFYISASTSSAVSHSGGTTLAPRASRSSCSPVARSARKELSRTTWMWIQPGVCRLWRTGIECPTRCL